MRALSIQQPFAEQILRGIKRIEYRSKPCRIIGERFYIYAAKRCQEPDAAFRKLGVEPRSLPTGVLVGTAEITRCTKKNGEYHWHLSKPQRAKRLLKPKNHPQPAWFYPF